jgi:TBC1 domain family protein 5
VAAVLRQPIPHFQNPWRSYFTSLDLLRTITLDVERVYPDMPYFSTPKVAQDLRTVLFLFAQSNQELSYRQGMHELAASLYLAVDADSVLDCDIDDDILSMLCNRRDVAADTYILLSQLLTDRSRLSRWYTWRDSSMAPSFPAYGKLHSTLESSVVSPVTETCNTIQNIVLKSVDPLLYNALKESEMEGSIYGMSVYHYSIIIIVS